MTVNACRQFAGTSGASLWEAMLEPPEAVVQLQYVIHEFPTSDEARLAKARLKSMGIDTRG